MSDSTIQVLEGFLGGTEEVQMVSGLDATISLGADPGLLNWQKLKWPVIILGGAAVAYVGYRWWQKRALRASASGPVAGYSRRRNKRRKSRKSRR